MPLGVIDRVNMLAHGQPELLVFHDQQGCEIRDFNAHTLSDLDDTHYETPGVINDPDKYTGVDPDELAPHTADEPAVAPVPPAIIKHDVLGITPPQTSPDASEINPHTLVEPVLEHAPLQQNATLPNAPQPLRWSTRVHAPPQSYIPDMQGKKHTFAMTILANTTSCYGHLLAQIAHEIFDERIVEMVLTQLSMARGLKAWGKQAELAIDAEMKQLHWRDTFKPVKWQDLSISQRSMVLESHLFLKQKSTGEINARQVAGGNKQ